MILGRGSSGNEEREMRMEYYFGPDIFIASIFVMVFLIMFIVCAAYAIVSVIFYAWKYLRKENER